MVRYVFGLQVLPLLLAGGLTADAYEFGDWVKGSPKVVDGATLSINGQQIGLHGILPINPRRICTSGGRRIPCKGLALAALGDMVQNAVVLCEIVAEDPRGRLTGRCMVDDVELALELVRQGLAQADPGAALDRAANDREAVPARGGPAEPAPGPAPIPQPQQPAADPPQTGTAVPTM